MKLFEYWNNYWFRPAPTVDLAICRIIIVGFQLFHMIQKNVLGRVQVLATFPDASYDPIPILHLFIMPFGWTYRPDFEIIVTIFWVTFGLGILALFGFLTNLSLFLFALGNLFMQAYIYSYKEIHHPEGLIMIALFVLALSPVGARLSIDGIRKKSEARSHFTKWPLLLVQWLFALAYFSAAQSKLSVSGLDWLNGYTLQYYLTSDALWNGAELGFWLSQHHTLTTLLSWFTVILEGTFFFAVLFPPLVPIFVPLGVALHTGIYMTMKANFFQWVAVYSVFVPWSELFKVLSTKRYFERENPLAP